MWRGRERISGGGFSTRHSGARFSANPESSLLRKNLDSGFRLRRPRNDGKSRYFFNPATFAASFHFAVSVTM
jgi:hypothetical protein